MFQLYIALYKYHKIIIYIQAMPVKNIIIFLLSHTKKSKRVEFYYNSILRIQKWCVCLVILRYWKKNSVGVKIINNHIVNKSE